MIRIIEGKDGLNTDYFIKASRGAALLNAGLVGLVCTAFLDKFKSEFEGIAVAATLLAIGFALFGKNIFNIWPFFLGGYIYSKYSKLEFREVLPVTIFATGIAPIVSEVIFVFEGNTVIKVIAALLIAIFIGFIVHIIAPHVKKLHKGYDLYNMGLTLGIVGTAIVSVMRGFGFVIETQQVWDTYKSVDLTIIFGLLFLLITIYGIYQDKGLDKFKALLQTTGNGNDYIKEFGFNTVLINMGTTALLTFAVCYVLNIPMNGMILGGVITIVGFAATGKHIKNITPIFIAVILFTITTQRNFTDPAIGLAMVYITGIAPLAGKFGFFPGIVAAYINNAIVINTSVLHGGLDLYNTGFAIGLTCAFILPIYETIWKDKKIEG